MAKLNITQIRELKKIYEQKIGEYFGNVKYPLHIKKNKIKDQIKVDLQKKLWEDCILKSGITCIYSSYHLDNLINYTSAYDNNKEIKAIREQEKLLCKQEKQKHVELEQWYMKALRCTSPEDIPEFEVEVIMNPMECVVD